MHWLYIYVYVYLYSLQISLTCVTIWHFPHIYHNILFYLIFRGIAGRRKDALESIRNELAVIDKDLAKLPIVVADSSSPDSLKALVLSTNVVISTTGPFAKYGSLLVELCAQFGTNYCDITGEIDWVRQMIDKYDDVAKASGARIVNMCGHDCVPWDLMVLECSKTLKAKGENLASIDLYDEIRATASGGTIATLLHSLEDR
jgi:short subunit dehydrogenase-like uncharacterized protein